MLNYRNHARLLTVLFAILAIALAIKPKYRDDWLLENLLLLPVMLVLWWGYRHKLFSRVSHTLIFSFLCLHEIGAHYTYSKVPYDEWWLALTGHGFNDMFGWKRNHFDRLVHFLYGLLIAYPVREVFLRVARVRGFWAYFLPLEFTMATSGLFELIEWGAALVAGQELGAAYLGSQGDIWDAQKDMLLAAIGAVIAMLITAFINGRAERDFAQEWSRSLLVARLRKPKKP
jgi:putative membrane protein